MEAGWSWWSFLVGGALGMLIGTVAMWIASTLVVAGNESDREERAADDQGRDRWR